MSGRDIWQMKQESKKMTPLRAIRQHCLDCSGDSAAEVRACEAEDCFLHPFRFGKNSLSERRSPSPEHMAALQAGNRKARQKTSQIETEKT